MVEGFLLAAGLILLGALDLAAATGRAAFQESNYAGLMALRDEHGPRLNRTLSLWHVYSRLFASYNLVLVLTRILLTGLMLYILLQIAPDASLLFYSAALILYGLLIFSLEWVLSAAARREPDRWAIRMTGFTRLLIALATPFVALPLAFTREVKVTPEATGSITEDELKTLVDAGKEEGVFEQGQREMIFSVIELGDTLAREIMVPRIDMLALEVDTPLEEAVDALLKSGHSRVPVYEETVDNTLGLLYAKDLLRVWREGSQPGPLRNLLRPAYFVPEAKKVDELLAEMQRRRIHMAIVVDEYGGVAGIVSLEDIVEEILGEIRDEYDQAEELPYQVLDNGEYIFQGKVDLDDFNQVVGSNLPKDEADTLGGYLYSRLGHVPTAGESIQWNNLELIVEQVNARRIRKVHARWRLPEDEHQEDVGNVDK